jgi:hypothetical protein
MIRKIDSRAALMQWFGRMNGSEALANPVADRDEPVDRRTLDFEGDLLQERNILNNPTRTDGQGPNLEAEPFR